MILHCMPDGTVRCLYTEAIPLDAIGKLAIKRASHVEPDDDGRWVAHIVDGPTLGPFACRSAALAAEIEYLESRM
jgi:hypothetical protein